WSSIRPASNLGRLPGWPVPGARRATWIFGRCASSAPFSADSRNRTGRVLRTKLVWGLSLPHRVLGPAQEARAVDPGLCEAAVLRLRGDRDGPGQREAALRHGVGVAEAGDELILTGWLAGRVEDEARG